MTQMVPVAEMLRHRGRTADRDRVLVARISGRPVADLVAVLTVTRRLMLVRRFVSAPIAVISVAIVANSIDRPRMRIGLVTIPVTDGVVRRARWLRELLDDGDRRLERRVADTAECGDGPEQDDGQRSGERGPTEVIARASRYGARCGASNEIVEELFAGLGAVGAQPTLELSLVSPRAQH
ncbi:MAG TPA: hypothetical protein VH210_05190 [Gaiellaceae bacterium]|nr:hypothetical protein [Gaiellaceae bacterium]